jgi:hypothetical protein
MSQYLVEASTWYRHLEGDETADPGELTFRYRWKHLLTGKTGERRIAILQGCIHALLLYWTCERWLYQLV